MVYPIETCYKYDYSLSIPFIIGFDRKDNVQVNPFTTLIFHVEHILFGSYFNNKTSESEKVLLDKLGFQDKYYESARASAIDAYINFKLLSHHSLLFQFIAYIYFTVEKIAIFFDPISRVNSGNSAYKALAMLITESDDCNPDWSAGIIQPWPVCNVNFLDKGNISFLVTQTALFLNTGIPNSTSLVDEILNFNVLSQESTRRVAYN